MTWTNVNKVYFKLLYYDMENKSLYILYIINIVNSKNQFYNLNLN